jgi:opacity protein-like surface antigen
MKWIFPKSLIVYLVATISLPTFAATVTKTIYSLDKAQDFQSDVTGEYYVQLGCFKNKTNATKILEMVRAKTNTPIAMSEKRRLYVVTLGPMTTSADVRAISEALTSLLPRLPATPPIRQPKPPAPVPPPVVIPEQDNWYVELDGGAQAPLVNNRMTAYNGFGDFLPPPYDFDSLSTKTRWGAVAGVGAGYRWQPNTKWLPAYSVGLRYKHYFNTNLGEKVSQFSLAEFTNYYNWNVAADLVMVSTKLNIIQIGHFLPFINAGAGLAFNRTSNYYEIPGPDEELRDNPGFKNNHTCRFTYSFGAGVDWQVRPQVIVSLDYEFQDLGSLYSGSGVNNFANGSLTSKIYQSNNILLSLTYLFGGTGK